MAPLDPGTPANDSIAHSTTSSTSNSTHLAHPDDSSGKNNQSQVISKAIASTVQQCLNISSLSHTSTSTVDSANYPPVQNPSLPCVRNVSDSSRTSRQASGDSNSATVPSDVSNVRVFGDNTNSQGKTHMSSAQKDAPTEMNHTFTFNPEVVKENAPKVFRTDRTPVPNITATITKERPTVKAPVVNSSTVTKTAVSQETHPGTVTKTSSLPVHIPPLAPADVIKMIETAGLKETQQTPPADRWLSCVRAFNFDRMPCRSPAAPVEGESSCVLIQSIG